MEGNLKRRFFEPLVLLATISQAQGGRIDEELCTEPQHSVISARREILRQLCRVCEFKKGGEAVTAMALEKTPQGPVYWLSAPDKSLNRIEPFLQKVLDILHTSSLSRTSPRKELLEAFIQHATLRLDAHRNFLERELRDAMSVLLWHPQASQEHGELNEWMEELLDDVMTKDRLELCELMYKKKRDGEGGNIEEALEQLQAGQAEKDGLLLQHYIGRLASNVCAANILARASHDYADLFQGYTVRVIPCGPDKKGPIMPGKFALESMAKRMLRANSPELPEFISDLNYLDSTMGLEDPSNSLVARMRQQFNSPNFKLRVHAEIALLEAVHAAGIRFYDNDRYIACSKGACFCCYHYIRHHPGRFVTPASHNKIWLHWGPPEIVNTPAMPNAVKLHRDLLIEINNETREVAKEIVRSRRGAGLSHPDSTTGFVASVVNLAPANNGRQRPAHSDIASVLNLTHVNSGRQRSTLSDSASVVNFRPANNGRQRTTSSDIASGLISVPASNGRQRSALSDSASVMDSAPADDERQRSNSSDTASVVNVAPATSGRQRPISSNNSSGRISPKPEPSSPDAEIFPKFEQDWDSDDGGVALISAQVSSYHF